MGKLNLRNRNLNQFDKNGKPKPPNWEYRFEAAKVGGKRQHISKAGFRTKKEAEIAGTAALSEYNDSGLAFKPSEMSAADFFDYWLSTYCETNLKETTVANYKKKIRLYLKPALGDYKLKALQPSILQSFLNDKFNEGFSRNSLTCIKAILTGSLDYAVEPCGYIKFNPATAVRLPLQRAKPQVPSRKKLRRPVTDEEWAQIMERFPEGEPAHIPLVLGYRCGFRIGEVFGLMWEDVDFENNTIKVQRQVQRLGHDTEWSFQPPKYDSYRTVDADPETMALLRREHDRQLSALEEYAEHHIQMYCSEASGPVYDSGRLTKAVSTHPVHMIMQRESGDYIQQRIIMHASRVIHGKEGTQLISEDFDYHSLRVTHASRLREQGIPEALIQERLGHADVKMTQHYIKPTEGMKTALREQLKSLYK